MTDEPFVAADGYFVFNFAPRDRLAANGALRTRPLAGIKRRRKRER